MLARTPIEARIRASAAVGPLSGKITNTSSGATEQDVSVSGTVNAVPAPAITVSTNSLNLGTTTAGTAGTAQSYTVSGSNLTTALTITAPAGVQISDDNGSTFHTTLSLTPTNGSVARTPIEARISAAAAVGLLSGKISNTSSGATEQDVSISGTVNAATTTLTDGTILVATSPSSSHAPAGVIGVNPTSGGQFVVSTGGMFSQPMHITEDPSGNVLYVSDLTATGAGAIIEVNLNNNDQQSLVAKGQYIDAPTGIVYISGHIYVVDEGNGSSVAPNVVDITPSNGKQNLLTSGGSLDKPVGVARANAPDLFILDEDAFGTGALFQLNVNTGALTVFSKGGGLFNNPIDLAIDQNGNLIVTNQNGSVVEVDRATGAATLLNAQTFGPGITSGTINHTSGIIYLGAMKVGSSAGQIFSFDPSNGNHGSLSQGDNLDRVEGVYIYITPGGGAAAAPNGSSPASLVLTPIQGANASLVPGTAGSSSRDSASQSQSVPVQTFSQLLSPPADSAAGNGTAQAALSTTAIDSVFANWGNHSTQGTLGNGL